KPEGRLPRTYGDDKTTGLQHARELCRTKHIGAGIAVVLRQVGRPKPSIEAMAKEFIVEPERVIAHPYRRLPFRDDVLDLGHKGVVGDRGREYLVDAATVRHNCAWRRDDMVLWPSQYVNGFELDEVGVKANCCKLDRLVVPGLEPSGLEIKNDIRV